MTHDKSSTTTSSTTASDADQKFLRMMSGHHLGVIEMARIATQADGASADVRSMAQETMRKQQTEIEKMQQMLKQNFGDSHQPRITPENQRMVEQVREARGPSFDNTFRETVIRHHEKGIQMIDKELPQLKNPELKKMTEKMKSDQQKEVKELKQKMQPAGRG